MKAYTDLEQSKRLTEILPLDSADMRYAPFGDTHPWFMEDSLIEKDSIPCWSLTALLCVIAFPVLSQREDKKWEAWSFPKYSLGKVLIQDDPVDACVELIVELNKRGLL